MELPLRPIHSGEMSEWFKEHAWKVCIRQKRIRGSNPRLSASPAIAPSKGRRRRRVAKPTNLLRTAAEAGSQTPIQN
jgi:hypothetical protein